MLIRTCRFLDGDEERWEELERYDEMLCRSPALAKKELAAIEEIKKFYVATNGDCYAGTSWGKDSVVIAHLVWRSRLPITLCNVEIEAIENPDCALVEASYLSRFRHTFYKRYIFDRERDQKNEKRLWHFDELLKIASNRITGIRQEESSSRRMSARKHGVSSSTSCRPILRWTGQEVFAYLHKYDLPIHPAYAYSFGGTIDREWLRVDMLNGTDGRGAGREKWEKAYYNDAMEKIYTWRTEDDPLAKYR